MSKLLIPDTWSVQFAMLYVSIWKRIIVKKLMFENYLILGTRTHSQGKNMWLEKVVSLFLYINWFVVCTIKGYMSCYSKVVNVFMAWSTSEGGKWHNFEIVTDVSWPWLCL